MQFIDLTAQCRNIRSEIDAAIAAVLQHGQYIMGPEVKTLETELAQYVGVKQSIVMSSGTTALHVALIALGVGPGDEVITTPFSFFGTVEVIEMLGATSVFVDIDPKTYNMDPHYLSSAITDKTKAIIPVSLYGQCADYDAINAIAAAHSIPVIEDAAQSFGAEYKGRLSCGLTTIACTSFFPSKPLGCYGDGGACFTNDECLAETMRMLINHGQSKRYQHDMIGLNGRCDTLQAAILLAKLRHQFSKERISRQRVASWYQDFLKDPIQAPYIEPHNLSVFAQYTIEVSDRDALRVALQEQGIPTAVHYPQPLHQQPAVMKRYGNQCFPHAEKAASRVMSLPFHPYMQMETVEHVTTLLHELVTITH